MNRSKTLRTLLLALGLGISSIALANGGPAETATRYYTAAKSGDIDTILQLIDGSFYNRRGELLESNSSYPEFLRKYYSDSEFSILQTVVGKSGDVAVIKAVIHLNSGDAKFVSWLVKQDASTNWKIVGEL